MVFTVLLFIVFSLVSCGRADEFIRQQRRVQPRDYRLQLDESRDSVTVILLEARGKMKISEKLSGTYRIKYRPPQASTETILIDEAEFVSNELADAFYPYSFDIDVSINRKIFSGASLIDEKKIRIKEGFRGTILDPDTGYGILRAVDTTTVDWEIKETLTTRR